MKEVLGRMAFRGLGVSRRCGGVLKASNRCLGTSGGVRDTTEKDYSPPQQGLVNDRKGAASATKSYSLPPPTWSLADLKLGPTAGAVIDPSASPVLTPEEVQSVPIIHGSLGVHRNDHISFIQPQLLESTNGVQSHPTEEQSAAYFRRLHTFLFSTAMIRNSRVQYTDSKQHILWKVYKI